jgi:predicted SAM-dependent methyltransferase
LKIYFEEFIETMDSIMRINVGCGQTPTEGWRNFDNSLSLRLSKIPLLPYLLYRAGLLKSSQYRFIEYARINQIEYADATRGLPLPDGSVDVLYSSHMLEHLDQTGAELFLKEARRLLISGGIIRIVVPDLRKMARQYLDSGDAEAFLSASCQSQPQTGTIVQRLRVLMVGTRHHQWMYDGESLCRILLVHGFSDPGILQPDETRIDAPGSLDLKERISESVYVEAVNP